LRRMQPAPAMHGYELFVEERVILRISLEEERYE
jgi:hypothetical protein